MFRESEDILLESLKTSVALPSEAVCISMGMYGIDNESMIKGISDNFYNDSHDKE